MFLPLPQQQVSLLRCLSIDDFISSLGHISMHLLQRTSYTINIEITHYTICILKLILNVHKYFRIWLAEQREREREIFMTLDNAKSRASAMKKCILNTYLSFLLLLLLAAYR